MIWRPLEKVFSVGLLTVDVNLLAWCLQGAGAMTAIARRLGGDSGENFTKCSKLEDSLGTRLKFLKIRLEIEATTGPNALIKDHRYLHHSPPLPTNP